MTDFTRFSAAAGNAAEELVFLRPEQIRLPRRDLPRSEQNRIIRLSASVQRYGILEPLCVRPGADENGFPCYELVDGERRLRAACLSGLDRVPCRVVRPDAAETAKQTVFARLRAGKPNIFEEAEAFAALVRDFHMTQEEIARRLSLSQSAVANKIRLLRFSPAEKEQILRAGLSERHARALLRIHDVATRRALLGVVIEKSCSVSATEALVDRCLADKHPMKGPAPAVLPSIDLPVAPSPANQPAAASPIAAAAVRSEIISTSGEFVSASRETSGAAGMAESELIKSGAAGRRSAMEQTLSSSQTAGGVKKFAVRDLRPLYNSIDRTLAIFRKTGAQVECTHRESDDRAEIVIHILRQS